MMTYSPSYWTAHCASISCLAALSERGLTVRPTNDVDEVFQSIEAIGKPYLTPILDPRQNDFTADNYFWIMAFLDGKPALVGGGRLDIVPNSGDAFLVNQLTRHYGRDSIESCNPKVANVLKGRVCYLGDLHSKAGLGLTNVNRRMFLGVANYIAAVHFKADVTYSFMRARDVRRGSADVNGFDRRLQNPVDWGEMPEARHASEMIVYRNKSSNDHYFKSVTQE